MTIFNYADNYWHPHLFIENAVGDLKEQISYSAKQQADQQIYVYEHRRINGLFWENLNLHHFPTDIQNLSISIGSMLYNDEVVLIADPYHPSSVNREPFTSQQEWLLYEHVDFEQRYVKEFLSQRDIEEDMSLSNGNNRKRSFLTFSCHSGISFKIYIDLCIKFIYI